MNASTVIAVCVTVIAVASLEVSVYEAWATRKHNRNWGGQVFGRPHFRCVSAC